MTEKRRIKKRIFLPLVALLVIAVWLAGLHSFTRDMQLDLPDRKANADAIVVLTGGSNRLKTGFELLEQDRGKKLFVSGVYHGVEMGELLLHARPKNREMLECCVVLGFEADNTLGNARETVQWMHRQQYKTMILVTANYHVKRALQAFSHYASDDIKIIPYPVTPDGLNMDTWWKIPKYRSLILREYTKYVASLLIYLWPGFLLHD